MTIKDYLGIIRQRLLIVIMTVALTTASATVLALRQAPEFEATSVVEVEISSPMVGPQKNVQDMTAVPRNIITEGEILKSAVIASRVIKKMGLDKLGITPEELSAKATIEIVNFSSVVELTVLAPDPKLAADIANAFPAEYVEYTRERDRKQWDDRIRFIDSQIREFQHNYAALVDKYKDAEPGSDLYLLGEAERAKTIDKLSYLEDTKQDMEGLRESIRDGAHMLEQAQPSDRRANGDMLRTGILGIIIGLPLALGLALLLDSMSDTIKSKEEAERIINTETLAMIPMTPEWKGGKPFVATKEAPYSAAAEAFRHLRVNLDSMGSLTETKHLLLTSPGIGEGKTTTSANLAVAFAEAGRSVLAVSADLRRPRLHHLFGVEPGPGLADILRGEGEATEMIIERTPNLYVLPSGSVHDRPDQLLAMVDMEAMLDEISYVRSTGRRTKPRNDENGSASRRSNGNGNGKATGNGKAGGNGTAAKGRKAPVVYVQPNVVLLDAPSVLGAAEVSSMAAAVDGVVLVLHIGVTRRQAAARAAEQIRRSGGKIAGIVMVGVKNDSDYGFYPPTDEFTKESKEVENSPWNRVVSGLSK